MQLPSGHPGALGAEGPRGRSHSSQSLVVPSRRLPGAGKPTLSRAWRAASRWPEGLSLCSPFPSDYCDFDNADRPFCDWSAPPDSQWLRERGERPGESPGPPEGDIARSKSFTVTPSLFRGGSAGPLSGQHPREAPRRAGAPRVGKGCPWIPCQGVSLLLLLPSSGAPASPG